MVKGRKYRIKLLPYMTKKSTVKFDFMEKFNADRPVPDTVMTGELLRDGDKLVQMGLVSDNGIPWTGWIIRSAVTRATDITEPVHGSVRVSVMDKKTVVDPGSDPEVKERCLFLTERFELKCADKGFLYFSAFDFEDICTESGHLGIPVERHPGTFFGSLLVKDEPVTDMEIPDPQSLTGTRLYPYQEEGIVYGLARRRFLLADDMGLGKTLQALLIAAGKKAMYGFRHCLVICGVNSVKYNWMKEIEKHTSETGFVLADGSAARLEQLRRLGLSCHSREALEAMGKRDRKKAEEADALNRAYFIIVNMEAFRNDAFAEKIKELCGTGVIGGILFDEMHKCLNVESRQSKNILRIRAGFKVGITGTPLLNRPSDAYFTFAWLEKTEASVWQWNTVYRRKTGQYTYEDRNLGLLKQNFGRIMLRRKKETVLDLPDKIYTEELVDLDGEQKNLYRLAEGKEMPAVTKILRLRQVTGIPGTAAAALPDGAGCSGILSAKMERLAERVQELTAQGKKTVIFSNWTETLDTLERYGITGSLRIDGSVSPERRAEMEALWQSEPEGGVIRHPVLAGTIDAMGTGLNLYSATNVIFVDEPWTDAKKEQAVDRCHRVGTTDTVNVITLMCRDTIDEAVHDVVTGKKTMAELLAGYGDASGTGLPEAPEETAAFPAEDYEIEKLLL